MVVSFYEEGRTPAHNGSTHRPRGLLPVPPEIEREIAEERARFLPDVSDEADKRQRNFLTLIYYYEDTYVAYRETSEGVEVLAVGDKEVGDLCRRLSQEELLKIRIGCP